MSQIETCMVCGNEGESSTSVSLHVVHWKGTEREDLLGIPVTRTKYSHWYRKTFHICSSCCDDDRRRTATAQRIALVLAAVACIVCLIVMIANGTLAVRSGEGRMFLGFFCLMSFFFILTASIVAAALVGRSPEETAKQSLLDGLPEDERKKVIFLSPSEDQETIRQIFVGSENPYHASDFTSAEEVHAKIDGALDKLLKGEPIEEVEAEIDDLMKKLPGGPAQENALDGSSGKDGDTSGESDVSR